MSIEPYQECLKTGGGGGGGRACDWSGWNGRLVPKYTFHSLTARCSSGWLVNHELITHELLAVRHQRLHSKFRHKLSVPPEHAQH